LVFNQQRKYAIHSARLEGYARELSRALRLGKQEWNVCFLDDRQIRRLNFLYRDKDYPTDVLSFPWDAQQNEFLPAAAEFKHFLGDIAISVETARRNARKEGHSTLNEIRWLILHGLLHLLGYDHESDGGEMTRLELALRQRMGISI
jgi:probable rRNA maturation factor